MNMKLARTIAQLEKQLKKDRKAVENGKQVNGNYGLNACIDSVKYEMNLTHKTVEQVYAEQVSHCLLSAFHNTMMVVACEKIMEEGK